MRLTREKTVRISHRIIDLLVSSPDVDFVEDRDTIRQEIVTILSSLLKLEEQVDTEVRAKISSQKKDILEGSDWSEAIVKAIKASQVMVLVFSGNANRSPQVRREVQRAFEKVRQSGRGMPAVMIRQLDALAKIMEQTRNGGQDHVLLDQAAMIQRANLATVAEEADRADVERRYEALLAFHSNRVVDTIT